MSPEILIPQNDWIRKLKEYFTRNEPVALPTETVYGLAAPANQAIAVARIFEIKERPSFNPLILHVREDWDLSEWAELNEIEKKLIKKFWPGPLSLLVKKKNVLDLVTAGSNKVVIRAPKHPVFREALTGWGSPLVAPSANSSTKLSPTSAQAVANDLGVKVAAVVDGGACEFGIESTIVEVRDSKVVILREGALPRESLAEVFEMAEGLSSETVTPGSMLKHYSPSVPLHLFGSVEEWSEKSKDKTLYLKVLASDAPEFADIEVSTLAPDNDFKTAAQKLFEFLRLAQTQYDEIRVLKTKDESLGRAINDRLLRASQR